MQMVCKAWVEVSNLVKLVVLATEQNHLRQRSLYQVQMVKNIRVSSWILASEIHIPLIYAVINFLLAFFNRILIIWFCIVCLSFFFMSICVLVYCFNLYCKTITLRPHINDCNASHNDAIIGNDVRYEEAEEAFKRWVY